MSTELGVVIHLVNTAIAAAEAAKGNNKSCDYIAELLLFGRRTLERAEKTPNDLDIHVLQKMQDVFEKCNEYISKYSKKNWVPKFFYAHKYKDDFMWLEKSFKHVMQEFKTDLQWQTYMQNHPNSSAALESDLKQAYTEIQADDTLNISDYENVVDLLKVVDSHNTGIISAFHGPTMLPLTESESSQKHIEQVTSKVIKNIQIETAKIHFGDKFENKETSVIGETSKGRVGGQKVAVKIIKFDGNPGDLNQEQRVRLNQAQAINCLAEHPNLLKLKNCTNGGKMRKWITEYGEFSLRDVLESKSTIPTDFKLTDDLKYDILHALARALRYLHMSGIIHGGLKPTNVLFCKNSTDGKYIVKLSDYAFRHFREQEMIKKLNSLDKQVLHYFAPEQKVDMTTNKIICTEAADVYAYSIICVEVLTFQIFSRSVHADLHNLPHTPRSEEIKALIGHENRGSLHKDPTLRTRIFDVCEQLKRIKLLSNEVIKPLSSHHHSTTTGKVPTAIVIDSDPNMIHTDNDIENNYPPQSSIVDVTRHSLQDRPSILATNVKSFNDDNYGCLYYICPIWIVNFEKSMSDEAKTHTITILSILFVIIVTTVASIHLK